MQFDLIVIGSGPGGIRGAIQAAKLGKKVAMIERNKIGGSSVHRGTIPSKSLREAALMNTLSFKEAVKHTQQVANKEARLIEEQLTRNLVTIIRDEAAFENASAIRLKKKGEILTAAHFLVATGTNPIRAEEFPFHLPQVFDSDKLLGIKRLPKNFLVIGAGVIGCEYASIFARLGSKVTLVDRRSDLLRSVDQEVVDALRREWKRAKIECLLGADVSVSKKSTGGKVGVRLNKKLRSFDAVLICMGRSANTQSLGLDRAAVKMDARGQIIVDKESYQTANPKIYAVGDVIGPPALAASSAEQGRIAACRMFSVSCNSFPSSFPYGIYTIPEISSVGAQEHELREKGVPYVVGRAEFSEVARGMIINDTNGLLKLLVHRETKKILGVHVIGTSATELIHIGQIVFSLGALVHFLVENVFNYPTLAEAYKVAALNALNQIHPPLNLKESKNA